jgi:hypothetical protein
MKVTILGVMSLSTRKQFVCIGSRDSVKKVIENVNICMCTKLKSYQPVDISCKKVTAKRDLTVCTGISFQPMTDGLKLAHIMSLDSAN